MTPRLTRAAAGVGPVRPVRQLHLGLGNFFRAHQAWYTDRAPDAEDWGIAAFTGRSSALAEALAVQDGLYTLVTRAPGETSYDVVSSLSAVHPGGDAAAWLARMADPRVAVLTLTVTEAGYRRGPVGGLDTSHPDVASDLERLRADPRAPVVTVPARLVAGLLARQANDAPLAVVPCDNLPANGAAVARVVHEAAGLVAPALVPWIESHVSFVTTMVDRITPATTDADRDEVRRATGFDDWAPVATEPFSEWVLAGDFPAGRPDWESAGARLVADATPSEQRKLWLLNGAHSLMAYAGSLRGAVTVDEAVADPMVRQWVEEWWDEAGRHLALPEADVRQYQPALLERWANPAIGHRLAQIAQDGSQKVPVRAAEILRAERAAGRLPNAGARLLAAWLLHLRRHGSAGDAAGEPPAVAGRELREAARAVVRHVAPDLASDDVLVDAVRDHAELLASSPA
ncbi:MAG: mannitol dehydrogenase family protein [Actinomycetes bacterium]